MSGANGTTMAAEGADFSAGPLWMIGCGNMGGAMLRRWVAAGLDPASVTVITRSGREPLPGVRALVGLPLDEEPATLVLALKPQQIDQVDLRHLHPALLLSILAGVEEAALAARVPGAGAIVRAMPNLPVAIGQGVTALYSAGADDAARTAAAAFATPLGHVEWIDDEEAFGAVTALAGCGPGFVFRFADALAGAGIALGLPQDQARRLALATLAGSAAMAVDADVSPAILADRVASPGGSTREGLNVLDADDALARLLVETLAASARRNAEMAAAARG
ncbi:pyrroline-5-carboxylate reductase [Sphingomonas sp. KR1UV-12]|uniref:Pyrroline-5-carboxylate reductase n=1 Tax=Sphingomonas aurea TaxID=3063994 RepID=A0ABT9EN68_9SPHN|nr:pyrroline-5-carboxylate reductase [Sphingomonas sp. KR1UV-12]MDP1028407.1 pyrroline-5-carboxylate reductase [Sphingomonas sp. KR1UV-12]